MKVLNIIVKLVMIILGISLLAKPELFDKTLLTLIALILISEGAQGLIKKK